MLETLQNFENVYNTNINKRDNAILLIPEIKTNLDNCELDRDDWNDILMSSKLNMEKASHNLKSANIFIKEATPVI